jgi:hypothetical protein
MHEFHADRDHAMCNIQNRSIPVVQLTQLRKVSNKTFRALGFSKAHSNAKCFSTKWQHDSESAWLQSKLQMSGFQPVTMPYPPKVTNILQYLYAAMVGRGYRL